MANDIEIRVGVTGNNDIVKVNNSIIRVENNVKKLTKTFNKGQLTAQALNKGLRQQAAELKKLGMTSKAAQKAVMDLSKAEKANYKAAKISLANSNKQKKSFDELRASIDPVVRAKQEFKVKQQELIRLAQQDVSKRAEVVRLLKLQRANLNQLNTAQLAATKTQNRLNVVTQQAGYQLSDFIVQVQSGTNPFVAFSQQASQLAGVLPLVATQLGLTATKAIALSTALGIGIPIVGAIGAAVFNLKRDVKTFEDAIDKAESSLGDFLDTLGEVGEDKFQDRFGALSGVMKDLAINAAKFRQEMAQADVSGIADLLRGDLGLDRGIGGQTFALLDPRKTANPIFDATMKLRDMGFNRESGISGQDFLDISNLLEQGKFSDALDKIQDVFDRVKLSGSELTADGAKLADNLYLAAQQAASLQAEMDGSAQHARAMTSLREVTDDLLPLVNIFDKTLQANNAWNLMLGKSHEEIEKAQDKAQYLKDVVEALGDEATPDLINEYSKFYDEIKASEQATMEMADAIDDAKEALQDLTDIDVGLDEELAKVKLQIELLEQGKDKETAAFIAGEKAKVLAAYETTKALAEQTGNIIMLAEATLTMLDALDKIDEIAKYKDKLGGLTSKGSKKETGKQYAESQLREAKNKRLVASLPKEQAKYEELLFKLQEANAKKRDPLSEKEIQDYARKIQGINKQTEAFEKQKKVQEELSKSISNSMEDGFMSIIDGTKSVEDAFRDMARQIIAELYRVLVVKKMVAGITSFFGFADGGVFQGGSQVQAYANGGVVGSPTYFPMSGGRTGLMGEAGPEAIMPLKRGKDGKLGVQVQGSSGDTITVNQTINVSTGVQQTVRTEIKSLMPQIAESAKSAVADAKRRGGSYGRSF